MDKEGNMFKLLCPNTQEDINDYIMKYVEGEEGVICNQTYTFTCPSCGKRHNYIFKIF